MPNSSAPPHFESIGAVPKPPLNNLQRPVLIGSLLSTSSRLRLLHAPAGFGKTALMAACASRAGRRVIWVALAGRRVAYADLLQRIGEAIQPGVGLWSEAALVSALGKITTPTWLMLDDFPRLPDADFDAAFGHLLAMQYDGVEWWITSRRRPQCNLPRLMLQGDLFELRTEQLSFSADEIATLLAQQSVESQLDGSKLFSQSHGWCADAVFRLMPGVEPEALLLEYLKHELLAELSAEHRDALTTLANLSVFDSALCRHIFGLAAENSLLDDLLASGAFLLEVVGRPAWFQVFAPVARLLAPLAKQSELLERRQLACQYFIQHGDLRLAIEQAVLAGQSELAATLLERLSEAELLDEQAATKFLAYRDQLPMEMLESTPRLVILYAYAYAVGDRPLEAINIINALSKFLPDANVHQHRHLIACWQAIRGIAAHSEGDSSLARLFCRQALEFLQSHDWPLQLACWAVVIQHQLFRGDLAGAEVDIRAAVMSAQSVGSVGGESQICPYDALLLESRGELRSALQVIERQLKVLDALAANRLAIRCRLVVRYAYLHLRMGQLKLAQQLFAEAYRLGELNADAMGFHGLVGLATLALLNGDSLQAESLLAQAEQWLRKCRVSETVYRSVIDQRRAAACIEKGDLVEARVLLDEIMAKHSGPNGRVQIFEKPDFLYETERLIARIELQRGLWEQADQRLARLAEQARLHGLILALCETNFLRAEVALARGDEAQACALMIQATEQSEHLEFRLPLEYLLRRNPKLIRLAGKRAVGDLLSSREIEVLGLIEAGHSNQEIADRMFISVFTVKNHIQRLSGKLEVRRRTQAVSKAKSLGIL